MIPALGLDSGSVRVGLAASDPTGTLASPVASLRIAGGEVWRRLADEVRERQPACLVVGLPRQLDGSEGDAAALARRFAAQVRERTGLPVELYDERLTTVQAERELIAQGRRRDQRRQTVDAVAAAILLQAWLDRRRHRAAAGAHAGRTRA